MKCCICGKDLVGQPAMVDRTTGEAFCSNDSHFFGLDPGNRLPRSNFQESKKVIEPEIPLLWKTRLNDGGDKGNRNGPVNFGDSLFVVLGSSLHALSLDGSIKWTYNDFNCPCLPITCIGIIVFVTLSDEVQAVDIKTGLLQWKSKLEGDLQQCTPVTDGNFIYLSNREGYVYALDASNGTRVWSFKQTDRLSPLIIDNGFLYASGRDSVVAINAMSGKECWSTKINHLVREAVTVVGNIIYVSSAIKVIALMADSGTILWDYEFHDERPIQYCHVSRPIVADRKIFIRRNDHSVSCIDLERHELNWRYTVPLGGDVVEHYPNEPVVVEGKVFCKFEDSQLHAIDAFSGIALWRHPSKVLDKPFFKNGILYFLEMQHLCALDTSRLSISVSQ